jgi:hypothetical protein
LEHFGICFGAGSVYTVHGEANSSVNSLSGEARIYPQNHNTKSCVQLRTRDKHKFAYLSAHTGSRHDCIGLPADKSAGITDRMQQAAKFRIDVHTSPLGRSNTQAKSFTDPFC